MYETTFELKEMSRIFSFLGYKNLKKVIIN